MTKNMRTLGSVAMVLLSMIFAVSVCAQSLQPTPEKAKPGKSRSRTPAEDKPTPVERLTNLEGFGTTGRIPKFGGGDFLVNSLIFESFAGRIGIGTQTPGSLLSVNGQIETLTGGVKFPDGSVQVTAGVAPTEVVNSLNGLKGALTLNAGTNIAVTPSGNTLTIAAPNALTQVTHDNSLMGNGTAALPLRVASSSQDTAVDRFWEDQDNASFLGSFVTVDLITVPAGKQLVVQHVSIVCSFGSGDEPIFPLINNGSGKRHFFNMTRPGTANLWTTSQSMTFHLNTGEHLVVLVQKTTSAPVGFCSVSASGRFVPVQ